MNVCDVKTQRPYFIDLYKLLLENEWDHFIGNFFQLMWFNLCSEQSNLYFGWKIFRIMSFLHVIRTSFEMSIFSLYQHLKRLFCHFNITKCMMQCDFHYFRHSLLTHALKWKTVMFHNLIKHRPVRLVGTFSEKFSLLIKFIYWVRGC